MAGEIVSKINNLFRIWPGGTVAVVPWLAKHGVYQQLAYEYERSAWIKHIGRGAYVRWNDKVQWPGAVYTLQSQLGLPVHVGAKTALELKGLGHFIPTGKGAPLFLFGPPNERLPAWFLRYDWDRKVFHKVPRLFSDSLNRGLIPHSFGAFEIQISAPERAMFEVLHLVPFEQTAEEAQLLMEGLGTLRPKVVEELLQHCRSVKVKRLFLALAERCEHPWMKKLSLTKVKLGKGNRVVVKGGTLDSKYQITLPKPEREEK